MYAFLVPSFKKEKGKSKTIRSIVHIKDYQTKTICEYPLGAQLSLKIHILTPELICDTYMVLSDFFIYHGIFYCSIFLQGIDFSNLCSIYTNAHQYKKRHVM